MICKNCGNVVKDNQTFCEFCGTRLTNQIFCPICGEKNDDGKFCRNCGASLPNNSNNTQQPLRAIPNHYDNNSIENKQEQKKRTSGMEIIFNLIFILLGIGLLALNVFACFSDFLVLEAFDITQKITLETTYESLKNFFEAINQGAKADLMSFTTIFIPFAAILIALVGTSIAGLVGLIKVLTSGGLQKKFYNIKIFVSISLAFILSSMLIFGMFKTNSIIKYGKLVMFAVLAAVAYLVITKIYQLMIDLMNKKESKEIKKSLFNLIEIALLIVLAFTITGSVMIDKTSSDTKLYSESLAIFVWTTSDAGVAHWLSYASLWYTMGATISISVFLAKSLGKKYEPSIKSGADILISSCGLVAYYIYLKNTYLKELGDMIALSKALYMLLIFAIILFIVKIVSKIMIGKSK